MKKFFVVFAVAIAVFYMIDRNNPNNRLDSFPSCAAVKPADQCVKELFRETSAEAARLGDSLNIHYTSPVLTFSTGRTSFFIDVKSAVPDLFQRLPSINTISITQYVPSRDQRGNEDNVRGLSIGFSRANAATVNWDRVFVQDIPKVADSYWENPAFGGN